MGRFLFLGSSHLAAYKLAHDDLKADFPITCTFFAALAADLAFTEVIDGVIRPKAHTVIQPEGLRYFFPEVGDTGRDKYLRRGVPLMDVGPQFVRTGGADHIDLEGVEAIFYACGMSPFDVLQIDDQFTLYSKSARTEMMRNVFGDNFLLRRLIEQTRAQRPAIRHHFIGAPLRHNPKIQLNGFGMRVATETRRIISDLVDDSIFDSVFRPEASVLNSDMITTRLEFFRGGRPAAQAYQDFPVTDSDHVHVNKDYAKIVFEEFVRPKIAAADLS